MITNDRIQDLTGAWEFKPGGPKAKLMHKGWMPARVPGNVHTDLMAMNEIPDPHLAENEADMGWVEATPWLYRRQFILNEDIAACGRVLLQADGLDTWATLWINGRKIGSSENCLVEHAWDVTRFLSPGENNLVIRLDSPIQRVEAISKREGYNTPATSNDVRGWARKPQYSFGWDWGPRLVTSGIFLPLRLVGIHATRITDLWVRVKSANAAKASGLIDIEVESPAAGDDILVLRMGSWKAEKKLRLKKGTQRVRVPFNISKPALWWPNGYGEPALTQVEAELASGAMAAQTVGLRTIELEQKNDKQGRSFGLKVNGVSIYSKGANWIPADTFLGRVTTERVERLVREAKDAHMTILRVWGGGIYETEDFYRACDRMGILVWQDFLFACQEINEEPWFLKEIAREAGLAARRLRRHPSLAIWCGNNENHQAVTDNWFGKRHRKAWGAKIYHQVLPGVLKTADPDRPYWPGSPFGGKPANSEDFGDRHNWIVWAQMKDYHEYRNDLSRYVSEFGFAALPNRPVLERAIPPDQRFIQSRAMRVHDKVGGPGAYSRINFYLMANFPLATGLDDFRYLSQVQQADALATGVEHWRRRKPATQGAIFWQLNDCWPVTSWAVLDGDDQPKLGYFKMKRSMDPVLLSSVESHLDLSPDATGELPYRAKDENGICECWLTLDGKTPVSGTLTVELWNMKGKVRGIARKAVRVAANSSVKLWSADRSTLKISDTRDDYLVFKFKGKGIERGCTLHFERARRIRFQDAGLAIKAKKKGAGWQVEVKVRRFAAAVELSAPMAGRFGDNGFDLLPGEKRVVGFVPAGKGKATGKWGVKTLNGIARKSRS